MAAVLSLKPALCHPATVPTLPSHAAGALHATVSAFIRLSPLTGCTPDSIRARAG